MSSNHQSDESRAAELEAQTILESMAEGFYGLDTGYRFTYINSAGEQILGRKRTELLGHVIWDIFPETRGTEIDLTFRKALEEGRVTEFSTYFEAWRRWFEVKVYPSDRGLAVYFRETTRQKQMEMALLDSQERFEMINNFIPVMVWTTRPDGYLDYFNRRWSEYTGMTLEDTQGWAWSHLLHPEDRERTMARWEHSLQTGEPYEVEYRLLRASDNTWHWYLGQGLPVRDRSGRIVRWFGTCTDIDDRKRVEEDLAAARESAEEASQAKSRFLASMSHELRTPLNAIIGYSEMLQEEVEDLGVKQLQADLKKIHSAGKHLLALISDILDLSKIEAGKMDLFAEEFVVRSAVEEVIATVEPLVQRNGNRLEVRTDPETGNMKSDLTKVRQMLFNLLSNAGKFTTNGAVIVQVQPVRGNGQDLVEFRVSDTGTGIPAEKLEHLFEPFSQLHDKSKMPGGTGLGLAITKRFCEMLGGEISVDSFPHKGSTFTIRLPRVAPSVQDHHRAEEPAGKSRGRGLVLIVDDDASSRDIMQRYLRREGYATVSAANGEEALRLTREMRPDVITLDVMMPGMDGWSVLQTLKMDPELSSIPVVMATMMGDRSLGFAMGAAEYLVKPVTRERLAAIMAKFQCPAPPCRVLIVEDDESSRELVQSIFEKEGWTVETAVNGAEGLSLVEKQRPSLVLLDLMMPVMDGFEFALEVRKRPEFRDIPVVVLTARDLTAEDRQRLSGNVQKVLSKGSLSSDQVLAEVRELIRACVRP